MFGIGPKGIRLIAKYVHSETNLINYAEGSSIIHVHRHEDGSYTLLIAVPY